jgi:hypothetical protein
VEFQDIEGLIAKNEKRHKEFLGSGDFQTNTISGLKKKKESGIGVF